MDFIADHKLTGVVAIFNCNTLGQSDFVASAQDWQHLQRKADAFGWTAVAIDGHDPAAIEDTLRRRDELAAGKPLCVVARTVKGWGVPNLGGMGHHGTPVTEGQLEAALSELDKRAAELGVAGLDLAESKEVLRITPPLPAPAPKLAREPVGFMAAVRDEPKLAEVVASKKAMSPRRAYGLALKALGAARPRVVALDADVKNSTYAQDFVQAYPDRYFEARIAEQNMVSVAAGLSSGGKIPFASTFGRPVLRPFVGGRDRGGGRGGSAVRHLAGREVAGMAVAGPRPCKAMPSPDRRRRSFEQAARAVAAAGGTTREYDRWPAARGNGYRKRAGS